MEKKNNNIQEIIKDLTSKMNIIYNQLKIVFDSVDKFKHQKHLIIYSYLMGYYTSQGNKDFNQDTLLNSLEIFERSLNRKTEFSNLIIALALSMNRCNGNENNNKNNNQNNDKDNNLKKDKDNNNQNDQNEENENNPPNNEITETMISNDPYIVYQQFFGTTVFETPLTKINNNEVNNNNLNNNNKDQHKNIVKINNKPNNQINQINKQINQDEGNKIEQKFQEPEKMNNVKLINNKDNNNINKGNINFNIEDIEDKKDKINNHIIDIDVNKKNNIDNNDYNQKTQKYNINNINNNIGNNIYNQKTHKYNINNILNQQNNQKISESYMIGKYNAADKIKIQKNPKNFKQNTFIVLNNPKKIVNCFICSENFNELDKHNYRLNCKCVIHYKCFINYVVNSIKNKKIPILCPKCKKEVKTELIYNCLNSIKDKKLIKLYENYSLELYIKNYEKNADLIYYCCPTPGCKKYIPCQKDEKKLLCPSCNKSYCIKCFRPWHENKTCEQNYIENSIINNPEVKKEFLKIDAKKDFEYKECPKCKALMLKEEGTNKIICVCGTAFCYKCGKIIKEKHDCSQKEK